LSKKQKEEKTSYEKILIKNLGFFSEGIEKRE